MIHDLTITSLKDIAIFISGIIALLTFINGIIEYTRQGRQKRVDQFVLIRRRLKENHIFKEICSMAIANDPNLASTPTQDKRDLLGLLEEVALLTNSNLIKKEVAHYMFGLYVVSIWNCPYFWYNIERDSIYSKLFNNFAFEMIEIESKPFYSHKKLRF
jgi:hypothetical protein